MNCHSTRCPECGQDFGAIYALNAHMKKQHAKNERFICDICNKSFSSKRLLRNHIRRHKQLKPEQQSRDDEYNSFIAENMDMSCDQCSAVFNSFYDAQYHYKESHNENNGYIKCCKLKLKKMWVVKSHIDSHWNPEKFK